MKLPLKLTSNGVTVCIEDAVGMECARLTAPSVEQAEALNAIVAAVNGQAAQEERIRGLLEVAKGYLVYRHRKTCDHLSDANNTIMLRDALDCAYSECAKIAAAIRAEEGGGVDGRPK